MELRSSALRSYRLLLRAQRVCFKGDSIMQVKAMQETRKAFEANRGESDEEVRRDLVDQAVDLADFLIKNVVQLRKEGEGRYSMKLEDRHGRKDK